MARIRTIKPEFPQSESMGRISREARLCFILMWTIADDAGRLRGNSRMLASLLYPYDDDAAQHMDAWLEELESEGCVRRYVVEGTTYAEIVNWLEHQKIDRPSASKLPSFDEASETLARPREPSPPDLVPGPGPGPGPGPRTKDLDLDQRAGAREVSPPDTSLNEAFEAWWQRYPRYRRGAKGPARKKWMGVVRRGAATAEQLLAGLDRYLAAGYGDSQFACGAEVWLNGERWTIEQFPPPGDVAGNGVARKVSATSAEAARLVEEMGAREP